MCDLLECKSLETKKNEVKTSFVVSDSILAFLGFLSFTNELLVGCEWKELKTFLGGIFITFSH